MAEAKSLDGEEVLSGREESKSSPLSGCLRCCIMFLPRRAVLLRVLLLLLRSSNPLYVDGRAQLKSELTLAGMALLLLQGESTPNPVSMECDWGMSG